MNSSRFIAAGVNAIPPSGIRKFFDIANEMEDAISLGVGEPDFVTPWNVREAAITSIEKGMTHYTSNHGMLELREYVSSYMQHRFALDYTVQEIVMTMGASEGIDIALRAVLEPGDEVLVPAPSYVSYFPCVSFAGGVPVSIETFEENGFILTPDLLEKKITPKTKAMVLAYPNNPTGGIMKREELQALADIIVRHDILVISDEIYAELTYGGSKHVSFAALDGMRERTIVINGFSKAFAMTGWRLGFVCADRPLLDAILKIHQYTALCAPIMSQAAALEALKDGFDNGFSRIREMTMQYDQRRRVIVKAFNDMGLNCFEPLGAFYAFPNISSTGLSSEEFCTRLLMEKSVACVPGTAFGSCGEGFMRCSYASSLDNIFEACNRIESFIKGL